MNAFLYASASLAIVLAVYLVGGSGLPRTSPRLLAAAMLTIALHNLLTVLQIGNADHLLVALRPVLAAALPALLFLHIAVATRAARKLVLLDALHVIGPLAVILLRISPAPGPALDVLIILLQVFYVGATAWVSRDGAVSFASLGPALSALFDRWRRFVLLFMLSVILFDIGIFAGFGADAAPQAHAWFFGALGLYLVLGFAYLLVAGLHRTGPLKWAGDKYRLPTADQEALLERLEKDLESGRGFLDPNLTLQRFARRAGLPMRDISAAINVRRNCNYNQWLNRFRIEEAQRLMREDRQLAMTEVMYRAGFQNKSTFNAAFRAIAGCSPTAWRSQVDSAGDSADQ